MYTYQKLSQKRPQRLNPMQGPQEACVQLSNKLVKIPGLETNCPDLILCSFSPCPTSSTVCQDWLYHYLDRTNTCEIMYFGIYHLSSKCMCLYLLKYLPFQVVIGGRNKYLINGVNANNTRVQDLFCSVGLNVNNPHFLIMQVILFSFQIFLFLCTVLLVFGHLLRNAEQLFVLVYSSML